MSYVGVTMMTAVACLLWRPVASDNGVQTETTQGPAAAASTFGVHMIPPFGKSSIRYYYTEPSPWRTPTSAAATTTEVTDQAYSVSVPPPPGAHDCAAVGRHHRKRPTADEWSATNTMMPLPDAPFADDGGRSDRVFVVPAAQLDQLYTVPVARPLAKRTTAPATDGVTAIADEDIDAPMIIHFWTSVACLFLRECAAIAADSSVFVRLPRSLLSGSKRLFPRCVPPPRCREFVDKYDLQMIKYKFFSFKPDIRCDECIMCFRQKSVFVSWILNYNILWTYTFFVGTHTHAHGFPFVNV